MNIINLFFCITLLMFFSSCQREDESREAGFPGETEEEFQETLDFVKEIGFAKVHIF